MLTSRLIDRPSRPLFPKGWRFDTQVIATVLSTDRENPTDVLAMTGASTALHLSDIPWAGPFAGVRVGASTASSSSTRPSPSARESELDLVVAASRDAIVMVEGGAAEVAEDVPIDALMFAHKAASRHRPAGEAAGGGRRKRGPKPAREGRRRSSDGDRGQARWRPGHPRDPGRYGHPGDAGARRRRRREETTAALAEVPAAREAGRGKPSSRPRRSTCASWC